MNILATVCARGGSKGVKNKNIRPINGKPLIGYTLDQLKVWGKAEHIVVSSDSDEILKVARDFQIETPFTRPPELATDTAGKVPAIQHALLESEKIFKKRFDIILDLDPTAPIRELSDLDACVSLYLKEKPKTLLSVVRSHKSPYFNLLEVNNQGYAHVSKSLNKPLLRRQDAPEVYAANASIYVYSREFFNNANADSVLTDRTILYLMPDISGIDIDREIDFKYVEFLIKEGHWKNE